MSFIKKYITYQEIGVLCNSLVNLIKNTSKTFDCIYAPIRGGLLPAVHLSHHLDIPMILNLNQTSNEFKILIVDDICDTGKTFNSIKNKHPELNIYWTTLFLKPRSTFNPNLFVSTVPDDYWIVFPYEKSDEIPNREI